MSLQLNNTHLERKGCPSNSHRLYCSNRLRTIHSLHCPRYLPTLALNTRQLLSMCPGLKLSTSGKVFLSPGAWTTSKASPIFHPSALPRSPGHVPTRPAGQHTEDVGADKVGHTGRQEGQTCGKTWGCTFGNALSTLTHLVSYKTLRVGGPCANSEQSGRPRAPASALGRSRALFSFRTFKAHPAPNLDSSMNSPDEPFSRRKDPWLSA